MKQTRIALLLASSLLLTACNGGGDTPSGDSTKATLTVATLDAGIGDAWLQDAARRFEEKYANATNFEEGKTGVQVNVTSSRSYDGAYIKSGTLNHDIYFTEGINYYEAINAGQIADITEYVKAPLTDYGESKSTEDKFDESLKSYMTAKDGKYYGVPFYDAFYGFVYDVTLWKENKLFENADGKFNLADPTDPSASLGPDGVKGTNDDGLPATYGEMNSLFKALRDKNITPFLCCDDSFSASDYVANLLYNFYANEEGADGYMLNQTFSGTASDLIEVSGAGKVTNLDPVAISLANGPMLQKQAGRYQTLKFCQDVMTSNSDNYEQGSNHIETQRLFVNGGIRFNQPKAMLIEGSWWENEAASQFESLASDGFERHDYAYMPMPFSSKDKCGKATAVSLSNSFGVVSNLSKHKALAGEFLKFLSTDAEVNAFTKKTSMTRPLNVEMDQTTYDGLTTYARSLIDLKKSADICYPYSSLRTVINHDDMFYAGHWIWGSKIDGKSYLNPWLYLKQSSDNTAVKYFNGLYASATEKWNQLSDDEKK